MDIKNTKSLNANTYNFISICRNVNVNQTRDTWANRNIFGNAPTELVGKRFTSTLKGLSDEEKMNEIIRYFLRNNTIYEIIDEVYSAELYTVIKGLGGRSLRISERHTLSDEILKEIYFKYYIDRGKMIDTDTCDNYIFGVTDWCRCEKTIPKDYDFTIPSTMRNRSCIDITFKEENNDINSIDKRLFEQVISDLLDDDECRVCVYSHYYIIKRKDGRKIQVFLHDNAARYLEEIMIKHADDINLRNKEKMLEKKMEGFR